METRVKTLSKRFTALGLSFVPYLVEESFKAWGEQYVSRHVKIVELARSVSSVNFPIMGCFPYDIKSQTPRIGLQPLYAKSTPELLTSAEQRNDSAEGIELRLMHFENAGDLYVTLMEWYLGLLHYTHTESISTYRSEHFPSIQPSK